jgi:hypothetical protein
MTSAKLEKEKHMKEIRLRVFQHMLKTRGWKYRTFLRYLHLFKYLSLSLTRGKFLESFYALMHYLDDVVDGDAPMPEGYEDECHYLIEKIEFSENLKCPKDEMDYLMLFCFELAERFEEDFKAETKDILNSLLFDAKRRGKLIIFPREVLMNHFHMLDIRGTIRATLKIFKEDPDNYNILEPLGMACRYQFDIEDFETDIAAGYVNVPEEDCKQLELTRKDFDNNTSPKIKKWLQQHAEEGMLLLEEHNRRLLEGNFSLFARATFQVVYEFPARKIFQKIISESKFSKLTGNNY